MKRTIEGNNDVAAIYSGYYRFCTPAEIISNIKELWPEHVTTLWTSPYDEVPVETQYGLLLNLC